MFTYESGKQAMSPDVPAQIDAAIHALTAVAESGADFAEVACHVITAVAANRGTVEDLLKTRNGSWEADLIRNIVLGTAGDDPDVLQSRRTKPILIDFDPDQLVDDLGLTTQFDTAIQRLEQEAELLHQGLDRDAATEDEATELTALSVLLEGTFGLADPVDRAVPDEAAAKEALRRERELHTIIHSRAIEAGDPRPDAINHLQAELSRVEKLYELDKEAYGQTFKNQVIHQMRQRGITAPIEFVTDPVLGADYDDPGYILAEDVCAQALANIGRDIDVSDYIERVRAEGPAAK